MPRPTVLSISSQVAYGHVGNSATIIALQTLGCTVIDIPTIILSSHPGHGPSASVEIPANKIKEIIDVLGRQGRLDKVDAVISGYLRSTEQVLAVKEAVEMVDARNPAAIYCCDPVIGDETPGIYVPRAVAEAIKVELMPLSDIITPNLFEFEYLTEGRARNLADCLKQSREKFKTHVLLTSAPMDDSKICGNLLISPDEAYMRTNPRFDKVAKGTGDLFTGLFVGHYLSTQSYKMALSYACGQLASVLEDSAQEGGDELTLTSLMTSPRFCDFPEAQLL